MERRLEDEVEAAADRAPLDFDQITPAQLPPGDQGKRILGLDDAYTGHASWRHAVRGLRRDLPSLGLSHIAEEADRLWQHGVSLVLSGHTHAGQVTIARIHELALGRLVGHRYIHGLYGTRGAAEAKRGALSVAADTLIAHYRDSAGGGSEIYKLEAVGQVRLVSQSAVVTGQRAVYDVASLSWLLAQLGDYYAPYSTATVTRPWDVEELIARQTAEASPEARPLLRGVPLDGVSLPASLGNTSQQFFNVGKFENKGVELGVTGRIVDRADVGVELQATLATNYSKVLEVGPARLNDVVVGQPAPVVRSLKVANAFEYEDPVFEHDTLGFYGPNLPTHIITVSPSLRLRNVTITARGEYQGGAWINQGAAHFLAQRGPYGTPSCDEVYRIVPWDEYHGPASIYPASRVTDHPNIGRVMAIDRARCYRSVIAGTLLKWPADIFKVREITVQSPFPFRLPSLQSTTMTVSVRNIFTFLPARYRSQDPEVGGSVEGLTFGFLDAIPAPAEFTVSLRTTF